MAKVPVTVFFSMYYPPGEAPQVYPSSTKLNDGPFVFLESQTIQIEVPDNLGDATAATKALDQQIEKIRADSGQQIAELIRQADLIRKGVVDKAKVGSRP